MKITKLILGYEGGDKIILRHEGELVRFDLSKVQSIETTTEMTTEEFEEWRKDYPSGK